MKVQKGRLELFRGCKQVTGESFKNAHKVYPSLYVLPVYGQKYSYIVDHMRSNLQHADDVIMRTDDVTEAFLSKLFILFMLHDSIAFSLCCGLRFIDFTMLGVLYPTCIVLDFYVPSYSSEKKNPQILYSCIAVLYLLESP